MRKFYLQTFSTKLILFVSFLMLMAGLRAQVPVTSGGLGQVNGDPVNAANGGDATGLGCGAGGANWYGGDGGKGMLGGGGGGAAGYTALNMRGGAGGNGAVVVASYIGGAFFKTEVYVSGTSFTVEPTVTSVKIWVIGAGGGGAGSTFNDNTSGGGGGAGGIAYVTRAVAAGDIVSYVLGAGGVGGVDTNNGSNGGNSSVTIGGTTFSGLGGSGGFFNTNVNANGGSFINGDGGANGGSGKGAAGDQGGGGGGGIGGAFGGSQSDAGGNGANAVDVSGLFAALSTGSVLTVTWKSFTVTNQKPAVQLRWETSFEANVTNFTVQYSADGVHFSTIGTVAATNNSNGHAYQFLHQNPSPGIGYYRIFQTSTDGKNSFSKTVKNTNTIAAEKILTLTNGNVLKGIIKFHLSRAAAVQLVSIDGQLISTQFLEKGYHELNIAARNKGYYILSAANESERILTQ